MGLSIKHGRYKEIPVILLQGRVIGVDSRRLKTKMEAFYKKNIGRIIIDISGIEFIDSYGLGVIVYYHTCMHKAGRELLLFNSNQNPQAYMPRLFELTKLDRVFTVINFLSQL